MPDWALLSLQRPVDRGSSGQMVAGVAWVLAHGAGNIPLSLHDWNVDFACWCSYKYLNSGPGSVSGAFVHQKHCDNTDLVRLAGWWGHDKEVRFLMEKGFKPMKSAEAWQLSNAPVLAMAVHKVALDLHIQAGMQNLREKSIQLTNYLEFVIHAVSEAHPNSSFEIDGCNVQSLFRITGLLSIYPLAVE